MAIHPSGGGREVAREGFDKRKQNRISVKETTACLYRISTAKFVFVSLCWQIPISFAAVPANPPPLGKGPLSSLLSLALRRTLRTYVESFFSSSTSSHTFLSQGFTPPPSENSPLPLHLSLLRSNQGPLSAAEKEGGEKTRGRRLFVCFLSSFVLAFKRVLGRVLVTFAIVFYFLAGHGRDRV